MHADPLRQELRASLEAMRAACRDLASGDPRRREHARAHAVRAAERYRAAVAGA